MAWTCQSVLLPPVRLSTVEAELFSIQMNLPPDVEAEIDYRKNAAGERLGCCDFLYWESFTPREGHFPLLCEELVRAAGPEQTNFARLLQEELSLLRERGDLGNVILLRESIHAFVKRKLESGEFSQPMEVVLLPPRVI